MYRSPARDVSPSGLAASFPSPAGEGRVLSLIRILSKRGEVLYRTECGSGIHALLPDSPECGRHGRRAGYERTSRAA